MSRKRDLRLTVWQNLTCSLLSGYTARTLTAPLDFVKIRTQIGTPETRHGLRNTFVTIYYREGVRAFWKGNLLGCLRLLPFSTLQLMVFQRLRIPLSDSCGRISPLSAMIAGGGAGLAATVILYPTDTVKTRIIAQHSKPRWAHYRGIIDAFVVIAREEGVGAFFRGVSTTLFGSVTYGAAMFLAYDTMAKFNRHSELLQTPLASFTEGCLAAAIAQTCSFPFDTIRKKMQSHSLKLDNRGGVDVSFSNMREAFSETVRLYGPGGLWRGLTVNLLKVVPYTGLMFCVYEMNKKWFLYSNGYTLHPFRKIPHPLIDQNLKPQEMDDEEDPGAGDWMISEED